MLDEHRIRIRFQAVRPALDERGRRLHAAAKAVSAGHGGVAAASCATKVTRSTIGRGIKDLQQAVSLTGRGRRKGAGRRKLTAKHATLLSELERWLEPVTTGDPMRPLRWVSKSQDKLATALCGMGHQASASSIAKLLEQLEYRRHVNRKTKDGGRHPHRDARFEHINAKAREFQAAGEPVISVDTKKKELIGEFKNPGSDYGPKGKPIGVDAHDFEKKDLGKVVPHGVYDVGANSGYASLGIDHDTARFAVNATRLWLDKMGSEPYPDTGKVMITADCGACNAPRLRPWKVELQRLADETGLIFQVCHYPPGTSKWNKIEQRMFCHITQSWRATPLTSRLAVVELIANTTTKTGLTVRRELDTNTYPKGITVSDQEMATLNLKGDAFHPDWNYTISPREQHVKR
jgi:hypothetical protein